MRNRRSLTKLLMFMLPALLTIAAYTTFYDNLFSKPACKNCEEFTTNSNKFDLRNILDLIDQLRLALAAKDAQLKYSQKTPLDLALLQDKLENFRHNNAAINEEFNSEAVEKAKEPLDEDKPLSLAINDTKYPEEEFKFRPPVVVGPETYIPANKPQTLPTTQKCTPGVDCETEPPIECNRGITLGCVIPEDPDPIEEPDGNGGGYSTVPLPASGYLLLTGILIVAIFRFKKSVFNLS